MPDDKLPPTVLRDIFLLWLYTTITSLDPIQAGSVSQDDILNQLQSSIDTSSEVNVAAVYSIFGAVANIDGFAPVKNALKGIPALAKLWSGSGPHPSLAELNSVFIARE